MPNKPRLFLAETRLNILGLVLLSCLFLSGCGQQQQQVIAYSFEGPPLALSAQAGDMQFEGYMDRTCMVGLGEIVLSSVDGGISCQGRIDTGPNQKGRIQAHISCSNGTSLVFTLRNLGADQGMGVGRFVPMASSQAQSVQPAHADDQNFPNTDKAVERPVSDWSTTPEVQAHLEKKKTGIAVPGKESADSRQGGSEQVVKNTEEQQSNEQLMAKQAKTDTADEAIYRLEEPHERALLVFFYHPWDEEAKRRLKQVKADIDRMLQQKRERQRQDPEES